MRPVSARPARVLFVASPFGWGGSEKHLEDLITRADSTRIDPSILCLGPDVYTASFLRRGLAGVPVHEARASTFREFRRRFTTHRPQAIVFVNGKLDLFPWQAYAAARVCARRVIAIEHLQAEPPVDPPAAHGLRGRLRRFVGWRARDMRRIRAVGYLSHQTVCVSNAVRRTLVETYGYPASRTTIVYNGIDVKHYRPSGRSREEAREALGIPRDAEVLVDIARLARLKRLDLLLQALVVLSQQRPTTLRCVIVGQGPLEDALKAQANALGLADTVVFVGHHDDPRIFLEAADVYVTSSEREGFGLALVEAMAYELPCVATDIGGHDEVLADRATGVLVPPGSPEALAHGIQRVLDHPAEARAMGIAARRAVEARFDIERMVAQLVDIVLARA